MPKHFFIKIHQQLQGHVDRTHTAYKAKHRPAYTVCVLIKQKAEDNPNSIKTL